MNNHTLVYKEVNALTKEEFCDEIDIIINERMSRWYMHVNENEYVHKMFKMLADSSVPNMYTRDGLIARYHNAQSENNNIINILKKAKLNFDTSVITEKYGFNILFDTDKNIKYVYICTETPFFCDVHSNTLYKTKESLIDFLYNIKSENIGRYENKTFIPGVTYDLIKKINEFYKLHGEYNLIFEFV